MFIFSLLSLLSDGKGDATFAYIVIAYWMGEVPIVCVADYMKMVETFVKDGEAYAGRYFFKEMDHFTRGNPGEFCEHRKAAENSKFFELQTSARVLFSPNDLRKYKNRTLCGLRFPKVHKSYSWLIFDYG